MVFLLRMNKAYIQPRRNSHSARQAADELLYVSLTGDSTMYENAVRELNWSHLYGRF